MTSKTITDRAGDTLRLSTGSLTAGPGEITVKVTERFRGREAVAAVHVDPVTLRAALDAVVPAGSYTRTAEKAEKEQDEARHGLTRLARGLDLPDTATVGDMTARIEEINCHDCIRDAAVIREPRPLTPEVTGEMIERAQKRAEEFYSTASASRSALFSILTAALTEPPARPEGAEELARLIADADVEEWDCGDLADAILATGRVRVVTEEQQ